MEKGYLGGSLQKKGRKRRDKRNIHQKTGESRKEK